jgi:hypothetical protein
MALRLALSFAIRAAALAALALVLAAASAACLSGGAGGGGDSDGPEPSPVDPAVGEFYRAMEEAMTRPGQVYHFRIEAISDWGTTNFTSEGEYWIDVEKGLVRQDLVKTDSSGNVTDQTTVVEGDQRTTTSGGGVAEGGVWRCPGISPAASFFFSCGDREVDFTITDTEFEGRPARALELTRIVQPHDQFLKHVQTIYADAETMLPIAVVLETVSRFVDDELEFLGTSRVLEDGFVDRGSLPDDHFKVEEPEGQPTATPAG